MNVHKCFENGGEVMRFIHSGTELWKFILYNWMDGTKQLFDINWAEPYARIYIYVQYYITINVRVCVYALLCVCCL